MKNTLHGINDNLTLWKMNDVPGRDGNKNYPKINTQREKNPLK